MIDKEEEKLLMIETISAVCRARTWDQGYWVAPWNLVCPHIRTSRIIYHFIHYQNYHSKYK